MVQEGKLTPLKRFIRLLSLDRKEIFLVYTFAIFNGLINLSLPLGIQAIIGFIASAQFSTSWGLLIFVVVLGVAASGFVQVLQLSLTELLQRRIFTRASFEFAYRIPRFKLEAVSNFYAPELMNRFFDTLTIQKGLSKILIDFSSSTLQILFGLILLSFYHPFFVFFGIILIGLISIIFIYTGPRGLRTSLYESKYKYQVAHWLEELARVMGTFKLAGDTDLPIRKTNEYVEKYLKFRKQHFSVLVMQFSNIVAFKTLITGGLLILGSILVINQEINLGQFVASEIIILLVLSSAEKLILSMETVYDVLTGIEKIGQVTDLPLESEEGKDLESISKGDAVSVELSRLSYSYPVDIDIPEARRNIINDVSFEINAGEKVAIMGQNRSGKSTLISLISGLYDGYSGSILFEGVPLRDINITSLRSIIGDNLGQQDLFHGTLEENICVGKPDIELGDILWAIERVGLQDYFKQLPQGLSTMIYPEGQGLSGSIRQKIILARTFAEKPKLVVMDNALKGLDIVDKRQLSKLITNREYPWTLIAVTDDPEMMSMCDKVVVLEEGAVKEIIVNKKGKGHA
jgi:ABC-type bacteriocin/lantibiotic exporter with double-glycine peptidase domain